MMDVRSLVKLQWLGVVVALAIGPAVQLLAADNVKRARPPQFAKSVIDAFFPDAREKLVGTRPQRPVAGQMPAAEANVAAPQPSAPAADQNEWSKWITAEAVEDEIKIEQLKLAETLVSPTRFKGGDYQRARFHFSVLATMFAIDAAYGEPIRWQRDASAERARLARAGFNCKVGTDSSYKEAKERADELESLVRGGGTPLAPVAAESDWSKVADRRPLMKRLEQAQQQGLTVWTANANEFARSAQKLSHEAQIVAALAEVIQGEGYEFADDETYREFAASMRDHARELREAIVRKDYEASRKAVGEIGKACADCHSGYRSNN